MYNPVRWLKVNLLLKLFVIFSFALYSPSDFKDAEQTDATEHGDAERRHDLQLHEDGLHNAAAHHKAVKAVKQRHEIRLQTQAVHLNQHLTGEHGQQHLVGYICVERSQSETSDKAGLDNTDTYKKRLYN